MIHSLAVQMARPDIALSFDYDADLARNARLFFLRSTVDTRAMFAGPHFRSGIVTIEARGASYHATPVLPLRQVRSAVTVTA